MRLTLSSGRRVFCFQSIHRSQQGGHGESANASIMAVFDDLARKVNLDTKPVYATGVSNGGIMSYRLAWLDIAIFY